MTNKDSTDAETFRLRKTLQNLELPFKDRKFYGKDPILIFDFLARLIEEADTLDISEGKLMVLLHYRISGSSRDQYRVAANDSRSVKSGGIVYWPESVQHLLRTYETEAAIGEAIDNFLNAGQIDNETDTVYAARLNNATCRCGNDHDEPKKITVYLKSLLPILSAIISCFQNSTISSNLIMEHIVYFAQEEADSDIVRYIGSSSRAKVSTRLIHATPVSSTVRPAVCPTRTSPPPRTPS